MATRILHWILALAVFYLFVSSWWMLSLPLPSDEITFRVLPFQLHKNVGITLFVILMVMACLFCWRAVTQRNVEGTLYRPLVVIAHSVMYLLLIVCCVSGYLSSSYSGWGTQLWWLLELPSWAQENDDLNEFFSDIHLWSCWLLLSLTALHIGAAISHATKNDDVVSQMIGSSKHSNQ